MASRTAILYENAVRLDLDRLADDLASAELQLVRPIQGGVWIIEPEGGQRAIEIADLRRLLDENDEVGFEWWFEERSDVYCRFRRAQSANAIEFGLEGTSVVERRQVGCALRARFLRSEPPSLGWVFDPEGVAEDYEWDKFFLQGHELDWSSLRLRFPDVLGIRRADRYRITGLPREVLISAFGDLFIVAADPSWHRTIES